MERTIVEISEADYHLAREFLSHRTGLHFKENKRGELESVLRDRLRAQPCFRDLPEYVESLRRDEDGGLELRGLVSRLTVGETHFFRNRPQFEALRDHILPGIIARKRGKRRRLRLWSAGCATGEEPYSLAILLLDALPDLASWEVHILASDINEESLVAAREGLYRSWSFREVEEHYRRRYFLAEGESFRIRPEVRELVTFRYLNLAEGLYPTSLNGSDALDLILCRNVMIYFRPGLSQEVTRRFFQALEPSGYLMVGHSEHSDLIFPGFSRQYFGRGIVYQRTETGPVWEKPIAIRFRGSGPLPPAVVAHRPAPAERTGVQRPATTEETVLFESAVGLIAELRPEEAVATFKRVLEINPRNERAIYSIAMLLANMGDAAGAAAWVQSLLEVSPLHLEATYLQALLARETGDGAREAAALKKTIYLNPEFVLGHFQMGVHHLRSGQDRAARRSFLNVLDLLRGKAAGDPVAGVDGMTVGRLRESVLGMIPGGPPAETA